MSATVAVQVSVNYIHSFYVAVKGGAFDQGWLDSFYTKNGCYDHFLIQVQKVHLALLNSPFLLSDINSSF